MLFYRFISVAFTIFFTNLFSITLLTPPISDFVGLINLHAGAFGLLLKAIDFAKQFNTIQDCEKDIIIHAKRTVVFKGKEPWRKKGNNNGFDVTMGSFDGAESCEFNK